MATKGMATWLNWPPKEEIVSEVQSFRKLEWRQRLTLWVVTSIRAYTDSVLINVAHLWSAQSVTHNWSRSRRFGQSHIHNHGKWASSIGFRPNWQTMATMLDVPWNQGAGGTRYYWII